ncbi:3'(2'),5'-bisphosphate nucleotidase CysQ [Croceicoccus sp. BE223]|uniref:3'(2'),5'-bisphosphate nucleotidase CysQ n=1 Tax=Croceicoccus sp. BE223 TaxID=2817716 RepID=UPI002864E601|nr:3'(2'),5'-bisphosphate nucleotidase CysQ [Croceicoccus sp. BE223]MDR7100853.1 myo-inositol-1(or 4)-monophosphatase [Croceicoccus sp. BE223]
MLDRDRFDAIMDEAGRIAMALWPGDGHAPQSWRKDDDSPVSAADIAVDQYLRAALRDLLPAAGWLSEETVDAPSRLDDSLIWLVDPIDGTRDFLRGRTGWSVSVALVSANRPLMAGLIAPARGEYWTAQAGRGSFRNGQRLAASRRADLSGARTPADALFKEDADLVCVEKPNSIALRIAMVAADEADLVATLRWGYEWDIGAAGLIAREAGASVTDAYGAPLAFNKRDPRAFGLLVSSPHIHAAAVERISERARRFSA